MSIFLARLTPLAQTDPFQGLSSGFDPQQNEYSGQSALLVLGLLVLLIVALGLVARWIERRRASGPTNSPLLLFLALCRAHRLPWPDRFVLWQLARAQGLVHPARLFVEPHRFDAPPDRPELAHQLAVIKSRLFAGLDDPAPNPSPGEHQAAASSDHPPAPSDAGPREDTGGRGAIPPVWQPAGGDFEAQSPADPAAT